MRVILGSVLCILGLAKVVIGTFALASSAKPVWLKQLAGDDDTVAGRVLEATIVAFGMFSVAHGLALLNVGLPATAFAEDHAVQYTVYVSIGVALVVFYWLIVYRALPVSKEDSPARYVLMGVVGGLVFLITAAVVHAWRTASVLSMLAALVLLVMIALYSLDALRLLGQRRQDKRGLANDLLALSMIPFNIS
jgi:hypothetical protein